MFRHLFPHQQPGMPREQENKSLGSGFIISADGHILTNAHVVDGADEVLVKLTDKREFKAKVLGTDKRTDIALIKIEASGLPVAKLGDPNKLKVGEWVVAIGSPFGFENSVTAGIVSAKGRALPQESFVPFIQTDAAINPGNSGGPLFNMRGEVIGVNSQIYSRSGGYMGLAFAIPIDVAMEVQTQLKSSGKVSRGRIGVVIRDVSKEFADSFGLDKPSGALVESVEKGTPADKAGIEPGDIVLKFDGKPVGQSSDLQRMVGNTKPGGKATLQLWRKGATKDVVVSIGEVPEDKLAQLGGKHGRSGDAEAGNRLGLVLSELSVEQKKELKLSNGLVIEDLRNGALHADLRPGDIILALISKGVQSEIKSVEQFNKLIAQIDKNATITLQVHRGDSQTFISIKGGSDGK
jgi:serine protease Do